MRTLVRICLVFALLWQQAGPVAAALIGCCEGRQPCCLVTSQQFSCAGCVAPAFAEPPAALPRWPQAQPVTPSGVLVLALRAPTASIWRPPQGLA